MDPCHSERQRDLLASLPRSIATELSRDTDVAAVWLGGSLGRGEGDALSDIDLVIVAAPSRSDAVVASFRATIELAGPVALIRR